MISSGDLVLIKRVPEGRSPAYQALVNTICRVTSFNPGPIHIYDSLVLTEQEQLDLGEKNSGFVGIQDSPYWIPADWVEVVFSV